MRNLSRLEALRQYARSQGWDWADGKPIAHGAQVIISHGKDRVTVNFYEKRGHLVPQGTASPLLNALKTWIGVPPAQTPAVSSAMKEKTSALPSTDLPPFPHIGMDESGKGDWFGPLLVAAVCVDEETAARLAEKNVRDSKKIAPAVLQELAAVIHAVVPETHRRVRIVWPEEYNRLHAAVPNVNRVLTTVYSETARALYDAVRAASPESHPALICDQFAPSPAPLETAFAAAGLPRPYQSHRAESLSIAVAAASILATAGFARAMEELGHAGGLEDALPRGASEVPRLEQAARRLIAMHGPGALGRYAKLNFRPVQALLAEVRGKPYPESAS
jgi:ribonuclease HIII